MVKGIILAAGKGTRLSPMTVPISKILLPVYDKPMIYYPLSTLISAGIDDVLVITNEFDRERFETLLGDGSQFGIKISYAIQYVQKGIADAFVVAKDFVNGEKVVLILGDNIFHADDFGNILKKAIDSNEGATIFTIPVEDPTKFGVVEMGEDGKVISIEEKPKHPKSNLASVGLYIFDGRSFEMASKVKPSARGEMEITDMDRLYMEEGKLKAVAIGGLAIWQDAGTFDSLLETGNLIKTIQSEQGLVGSPEIEALRMGLVDGRDIKEWVAGFKSNGYYDAILKVVG
ncbi:MAG: NTP transferase domain-containing protein [Candidatus Methanomethylophilaceae archaeon]|nr:NTP transferase domain-containing protein [Candidatus Methanomethylophilaceae archaeon]